MGRNKVGRSKANRRAGSGGGSDRKSAQLARQVQRRLDLVFGGEITDPIMEGVYVVNVVAEPGGALLVHLLVPATSDLEQVREHLETIKGRLRAEVAEEITRRKAPFLRYMLTSARALEPRDGADDPPT